MFEPLMKFFGYQPTGPSADVVSDGESHWFRPNPSYSSLSGEEISQTSLLSSSACVNLRVLASTGSSAVSFQRSLRPRP